MARVEWRGAIPEVQVVRIINARGDAAGRRIELQGVAPRVEHLALEPVMEGVALLDGEAVVIGKPVAENLRYGRKARIRYGGGKSAEAIRVPAGGADVGVGIQVANRLVVCVVAGVIDRENVGRPQWVLHLETPFHGFDVLEIRRIDKKSRSGEWDFAERRLELRQRITLREAVFERLGGGHRRSLRAVGIGGQTYVAKAHRGAELVG